MILIVWFLIIVGIIAMVVIRFFACPNCHSMMVYQPDDAETFLRCRLCGHRWDFFKDYPDAKPDEKEIPCQLN